MAYLYDAEGNAVLDESGNQQFWYRYVTVTEGEGENPLTAAVESAAETCRGANEYESALAINDWLCAHVSYDENLEYYSPEGVFFQGRATCNGYSRAFALMADALGLENMRATGRLGGNGHAWNLIQMDGDWYQMDPTWNDQAGNEHMYFGVTDELIEIEHSEIQILGEAVTCNALADNYFIRSGAWQNLETEAVRRMQGLINLRTHMIRNMEMGLIRMENGSLKYNDPYVLCLNGRLSEYGFNHRAWENETTGEIYTDVSFAYDPIQDIMNGEILVDGRTLTIPAGVTELEEEAFAGTGAYYAVIPENCVRIGPRVFADSMIWEVTIPDSVTEIDAQAFADTQGLVIQTQEGSAAAEIAREQGIPLRLIE